MKFQRHMLWYPAQHTESTLNKARGGKRVSRSVLTFCQ